VVLGAVSSRPLFTKAGELLIGKKLTDEVIAEAGAKASSAAKPMDNTDLDLYWRRDVVSAFVGYALREIRGDDMRAMRLKSRGGRSNSGQMTELRALDIHSHIVPEKFPAYTGVGMNIPWPSMAPAHACHAHVMIEGKVYRTVHQSCWLSEERIRDMDKGAIGVQCLSPMPLLSYWLLAADAQRLIRFLNEEIATCRALSVRFIGLGAVPLQDMDLALRELEYVVNELNFPGVEIASHVNGVSIGDPRFEPFFAAAERTGAAIFVHALRPAGQDRIVGGVAEQVICFPGDIGLAAASMITGGIADKLAAYRLQPRRRRVRFWCGGRASGSDADGEIDTAGARFA
jgi:hypothetical protein